MTEKNVFVYKLFLPLNTLFFGKNFTPSLKKVTLTPKVLHNERGKMIQGNCVSGFSPQKNFFGAIAPFWAQKLRVSITLNML